MQIKFERKIRQNIKRAFNKIADKSERYYEDSDCDGCYKDNNCTEIAIPDGGFCIGGTQTCIGGTPPMEIYSVRGNYDNANKRHIIVVKARGLNTINKVCIDQIITGDI